MPTSPKEIIKILRGTRKILLSQWGKIGIINQKDESACNIVTEMDIKVENLVKEKLFKLHPDIKFVGEECGGNRGAESFWLMDPIDGTQHYVRGLPFCTSMLALVENGEVVFAAIYDFINDDMYWAQKGKGAFCDSRRLQVSRRSLKDSYVCFETRMEREKNRNIFFNLLDRTHLVKTISAGWEFAMIADGKLDGRICFDPYGQDYDFAPGCLLVSEAGGIVANIDSTSKKYDFTNTNFIAASPIVHEELSLSDVFLV